MPIDSNSGRGSQPRPPLSSISFQDSPEPERARRSCEPPDQADDWLRQAVTGRPRGRPGRARSRAPAPRKGERQAASSPDARSRATRSEDLAASQQPLPRFLVYPASSAFCIPAALFRNAGIATLVRRVRVVADPASATSVSGAHAFDGFAMFNCHSQALERLFVVHPYTRVLLEWRLDQVEYPEGIPTEDAVARLFCGEAP